jgi:predicted ATPase/DNA-binding winged helix-turn-helix (wHTH) protein
MPAADTMPTPSAQMSFGPFRLLPARQLLLDGERPVRLGSRACDLLAALVERQGELVSKQELMGRVWPDTFVEEGNLRVHMTALRRALGDGRAGRRYIANVPGRGYRFVAPVSVSAEPPEAPEPPRPAPKADRAAERPAPSSRIVGRSDVVARLAQHLLRDRFITVVGPGGVGKTTVAEAVAETLAPMLADGVRLIDLAALSDPLLVPTALAAALGIAVRSDDALPGLLAFLGEKRLLIVLDGCEHLVDAAASLAEQIFGGTRGCHVLATSREALRARGERVHQLAPLAFPACTEGLTAEAALTFPSVQLFAKHATAAGLADFRLDDAGAPLVGDIVRRLDGIPLAIEIAAGQAAAFGVAGLASRIASRLPLLAPGRRTAQPRHRTLSAALDWSHAQLPEAERVVLRRLAIFAGTFTLASANAVLAAAGGAAGDGTDAIASLIAKSLVSCKVDGRTAFYRLLDTTRAYALAKLEEAGERDRLARLHAEHCRDLLEGAEAAWHSRPVAEWLDVHRHLIDNVRAALDWSFSATGDQACGAALTVAAIPLWFALSLVSEGGERIGRALAAPPAGRDADCEMRLHAARAWSLMQTRGAVRDAESAWGLVLEMAGQRGSVDYQLRALWGLWSAHLNRGELRPALALAERFAEVAGRQEDGSDHLIGDRMIGYIHHLLGDQPRARRHIERMLAGYAAPVVGAGIIRFVFDQRATAQCFLARILWLQGLADQAMLLVREIVAHALASGDVLSLCQALVQAACPVAFFVGDLAVAEEHVTLLLDHSRCQALEFWQSYGHCFEGMLAIRHGRVEEGLATLAAALAHLRHIQYGVYYSVFLAELADALGRAGRPVEGLRAVDEALARSQSNHEHWYMPELWRIRGSLLVRQGGPDALAAAEAHFRESLRRSREQATPAWQLRAAISLARLQRDASRPGDGHRLLGDIHAGFSEGFATADLEAARTLLEEPGLRRHGEEPGGRQPVTERRRP